MTGKKKLPDGWTQSGDLAAFRVVDTTIHEESADEWDDLVSKCETYDAQYAAKTGEAV